MSNILSNWWRSYQFLRALRRGEQKQAHKLWGAIESSQAKLNWLEKLFKSNHEATKRYKIAQEELSSLRLQVTDSSQQVQQLELLQTELSQQIQELELSLQEATAKSLAPQKSNLIAPNPDLIDFISKTFKFVEHDEHFLQVTGLDHQVFDKFEANLAKLIQDDFAKMSRHPNFKKEQFQLDLAQATDDLHKLKKGLDPRYDLKLSPHIYLLTYFLEGVYSSYLSWFLIYKSGLLPVKNNILDIAAGFSTVSFGLDLFLESGASYLDLITMHTSYCSVEQQGIFQDKGLEFGRRYLEFKKQNTYQRFDTASIFDNDLIENLPKQFFDFVVISHCFFKNEKTRKRSEIVYRNIFYNCLNSNGYVLLIIQDNALLKPYGFNRDSNISTEQEEEIIIRFLNDFGLELDWYKYLSSTKIQDLMSAKEFGIFAKKNLPFQNSIGALLRQYTDQKYTNNYTLDDYIILARK